MRFITGPDIELLYKETRVVLHIDNRFRGDVLKQLKKIDSLDHDYTLELKKKRSNEDYTAQQYIWGMINKIAEKKNREPIALYKELVINHTNHSTVYYSTIHEAKRSKEEWESRGIGWMYIKMTDYKDYIKCERTRGYSGWYWNELDRFIRMLEQECKSLGVYDATRMDKN